MYESPSSRNSRVEPSISVITNVTIPLGSILDSSEVRNGISGPVVSSGQYSLRAPEPIVRGPGLEKRNVTNHSDIGDLADLLAETGQRHHEAFVEVGGEDPEWPMWYAEYMLEPITRILDTAPTRSKLVQPGP